MGDNVSDILVAVDGNNAVDQSVSEADVGTGNDEFGLDADFSRDQAVVEIKDFAVTNDVLSVFRNAAMSDEEISFAFDAARGGVIALVASEEIAIL